MKWWDLLKTARALCAFQPLEQDLSPVERMETRPIKQPGANEPYAVSQRQVDIALRGDGSLFVPGSTIWSLENLEDLYERYNRRPDTSGARAPMTERRTKTTARTFPDACGPSLML